MSHLLEAIPDDENQATPGNGMKAADLRKPLSKKGPFAAFDPTDVTFGNLKSGKWSELLKPENKIHWQP